MKILDIAAGTGSSSRPLVDKGAEVIALDFSEGMLAQGRKQHKDIKFVQGNALKLPFNENTFDVKGFEEYQNKIGEFDKNYESMKKTFKRFAIFNNLSASAFFQMGSIISPPDSIW